MALAVFKRYTNVKGPEVLKRGTLHLLKTLRKLPFLPQSTRHVRSKLIVLPKEATELVMKIFETCKLKLTNIQFSPTGFF